MLFVLIFNLFFIVIYFIYIVKLVLISIVNFFFFLEKREMNVLILIVLV